MWVVIRENSMGLKIYGPFPALARASGFGWTKFGAIGIGNVWHIRKLES